MSIEELIGQDAREPYSENIDELLQLLAEAQALEAECDAYIESMRGGPS